MKFSRCLAGLAAATLLGVPALAQAPPPPFAVGDVFLAIGSSRVARFSSTGTFIQMLTSDISSAETTGMAFDRNGHIYVTHFQGQRIARFDNRGVYLGPFGPVFNRSPESIVINAAGEFYVGQADGNRDIVKLNAAGTEIDRFDVATEDRGSDWIDLAADQRTLFYTSEGRLVKRYDTVSRTQLADFADLGGGPAFALRLLPGGGMLVARSSRVIRLNASGQFVREYVIPGEFGLFSLNLDPDGRSFWTASIGFARAHKVDIDSGAVLLTIDASDLSGVSIAGVSVFGEITVSNPNLTADPASLSFLSINRSTPPVQTVTVSRLGGESLTVDVGESSPTCGAWLSMAVVPPGTPGMFVTNAVVPPGTTPVVLYVRALPGSIPFGTCTNSIRVVPAEDEARALTIPVTFELRPSALTISGTCPEVLTGDPISTPFTISGATASQLTLTLTGPPFLSLSPPGGLPVSGTFVTTLVGTAGPVGSHPITIQAQQASLPPATLSCQVRIREREERPLPPVVISSAAVCPSTTLTVGQPFTSQLSASGGGNVINFDIDGQLPSGLNLTGNTIAGVPTTAGTFTYVVRASSGSSSAEATCRVTVAPGPLRITTSCPSPAPQGSQYSFPVIPSGGLGGNSYEITATGLPAGLATSPGGIRGTARAVPGNYSIQIQVRSGDQTVTQSCTLTVAEPINPPQVSASCPEATQVGTAISFPLTVSGAASHSFSLEGPSWLSISSSGNAALVSGTPPEAGMFPITVTVTDPNGASTRVRCTINVTASPLTLTSPCPSGPVNVGEPLTIPVSVTGGRPPYSILVSGPPWLSLNASGASGTVSGTPPEPGSFPVTISVTDAASVRRENNCTITVAVAPLRITGGESCPAAPISRTAPVSIPLTAAGGREPLTWRIQGPPWLTLSSTTGRSVTVQGTPTGAGPANFTVSLSDASGATPASFQCAFTVNPVPPPNVQVSGLTVSPGATETGEIELRLSAPAPVPLVARIDLSFTPDVVLPGVTNNPAVQFVPAGNVPGAVVEPRTVTVPIAAGQQVIPAGARVSLSNVAGAIRIQLGALNDGTVNIATGEPPASELRVARSAPVISSVNFTRGGIVIRGFSSTLNMQSITLTFAAAPDVEIEGPSTFTFTSEVQQFFQNLYTNRFRPGAPDATAGSSFEIRFPVTLGGDDDGISSVTVALENAAGRTTSQAQPLQ